MPETLRDRGVAFTEINHAYVNDLIKDGMKRRDALLTVILTQLSCNGALLSEILHEQQKTKVE